MIRYQIGIISSLVELLGVNNTGYKQLITEGLYHFTAPTPWEAGEFMLSISIWWF